MFKRFTAIIMVLALTAGMIIVASRDFDMESFNPESVELATETAGAVPEDTIVVWYTDDALTEYLKDAALTYRSNSDMKVKLELVPGVDYLESINEASISENSDIPAPDLYITTHDNLMKAYLAGLAAEVGDAKGVISTANFPDTSIHAITCNGKYVGYPLYYETNFFLFNKSYMASIAQNAIQSQSDIEEGKEAEAELNEKLANGETPEKAETLEVHEDEEGQLVDENGNVVTDGEEETPMGEEDSVADQEILERLATMIPSTIEDVLTFANNYEAPEAVEAVCKWDITDIFYNYFFVGNYLEVGGDDGDNNAIFNLYNQQAVECLSAYQGLNQYFSFDTDKESYDTIIQDFIDGKLVFTVATTDAIAKIAEAKAKGEFNFDYGITVLPDMTDLLKARGLSVTDVVAINGYSKKKAAANDFAATLSFESADSLYNESGKLACKRNVKYDNEEIYNVMTEYEKSMPLPKMIEASNYWLQLEIALSKIWNGQDPDEVLKALSEKIGGQIDEITYSIPVQESIEIGGAGIFK